MSIKAFELVPAIDRLKLVSEKSKSEVFKLAPSYGRQALL